MNEHCIRKDDGILILSIRAVTPSQQLFVPGVGVANEPHQPVRERPSYLHPKLRLVDRESHVLREMEYCVRLYSRHGMEPRQRVDLDRWPRYDRHGNREGRGAYFGRSSSSPDDYDL